VKTRAFFANENEYISSKGNLLGSNHLLQQIKQLTKKTKTTDAPRKTHIAWSNKNIVFWKVAWFLPMKKGCLGGIPNLWRLYFLDISWGDAWASPSLRFCPFFNSSNHSPIPTLENFLHTKLNTNLLATLV
jgi:hypothetical protein